MVVIVNTVVAMIPAALILLWAYRRDSARAEDPKLVIRAFLLGFIAAFVAIGVGLVVAPAAGLLPPLGRLLYRAFVVAAFTEELAKLLVVALLIRPHPQFDEIADGLVYSMAAGLGFAFLENVLFAGGPTFVLLLRAFTAVPLHAIAAGAMGYYVGRSKFAHGGDLATGLLAAIAIHGVYDALVFSAAWPAFLAIPLLIGAGIWVRYLFTRAVEEDRAAGRV